MSSATFALALSLHSLLNWSMTQGRGLSAPVTCMFARNAECDVPEPESRENKKRLKNRVLCSEMGSTKDAKEFWRDSIIIKLKKANTRSENES